MNWRTKMTPIEFSRTGAAPLALEIEELVSLEETIDELFLELERSGNPSLLEELSPYFGCIWPAAMGLTQYLLDENPERNGAVSILEVGCGLAVPSLTLAKTIRLSKVIATDFHPEVPNFFARNCVRNSIPAGRLEYRALDWRNPPADLGRHGLVIGSDVLYEKTHPGDLAEGLVRLAKPSGRIVIADPARPYLQLFIDEMKARGFGADPQVVATPTRGIVILDFERI